MVLNTIFFLGQKNHLKTIARKMGIRKFGLFFRMTPGILILPGFFLRDILDFSTGVLKLLTFLFILVIFL